MLAISNTGQDCKRSDETLKRREGAFPQKRKAPEPRLSALFPAHSSEHVILWI